jgi:glutaminase
MLGDGATLSARWFQPKEETSYSQLWRIDPTTNGRTYCYNNGEFYMYGDESRKFSLTGAIDKTFDYFAVGVLISTFLLLN